MSGWVDMTFDDPGRISPEQERLFDLALKLDPRLKAISNMVITQIKYVRAYDEFGTDRYHDQILFPLLDCLEKRWIKRGLPRAPWLAAVDTLSWLIDATDPGNGPGFTRDPGGLT